MKKQIILNSCMVLGLIVGAGFNQAFGDSRAEAMQNARLKAMSSVYLKESKTVESLRKELDNILAADMKKLDAVMSSNLVLKREYAIYQSQIKAIFIDSRFTLEKKLELLENLSRKHIDLFTRWFRLAKIDEKSTELKFENAIRTYAMGSGKKYEFSKKGFLTFSWRFLGRDNENNTPADQEIVLTPPFLFKDTQRSGGGRVSANLEDGKFSASADRMFVGGHDNRSGLGHFIEVPQGGFNKVKVVATLPETDVYLTAFSELLGASGASAKSSIDVLSDNEIVCRQDYDHGWVLAPALWLASESFTDTVNISCEFNAPRAGTEIVVHFESTASVWAGGAAFSVSSVYAQPRDIKVKFSRR